MDLSCLPEEYRIALPVVQSIARDFGYEIPEAESDRMVTAIFTSHGIDKAFDEITQPEQVSQLVRLVLSFIETGDGPILEEIRTISPAIVPPLQELRSMAEETRVVPALHSISKRIFEVMQRTRTTTDPHAFIRDKVQEAELSADMAFLFTLQQAEDRLKVFLKELTIALNLLDDFNDSKDDYRNQLMAFKPTVGFRLRTLIRALKSLGKAMKIHPKPLDFLWRMRSRNNFKSESVA